MTKETIEKLQGRIEDVLAASVNPEDGHDVKAKLAKLSELLVVGSNCVTQATRIHRQLHGEWLRQHMDKINEMKPSVAKHFVDTALVATISGTSTVATATGNISFAKTDSVSIKLVTSSGAALAPHRGFYCLSV